MSEEYEILNEQEVRWGRLSPEDQEAIKGADEARAMDYMGKWSQWYTCRTAWKWDHNGRVYQGRNKKAKEKRLLTLKEVWGRTLVSECKRRFIIDTSYISEEGTEMFHRGGGLYRSMRALHEDGYRLADDSLAYENATSLEVEV